MARKQSAKKSRKGSGFGASSVFDVLSSGKDSQEQIDATVRIRVHVGAACERELVLAVKRCLCAERAGGVVEVMGLVAPGSASELPDAAIVLAGPGEAGAAPLVRFYAGCSVPVAAVCASAVEAPDAGLHEGNGGAWYSVVAASAADAVAPKLADWLARSVDNKIALAANFAFCRDAVATGLTLSAAAENAAVGAISLIPGSDFPIMCVTQAKLALDIAAAYGNGLTPARAAEVAGVLGLGVAYRGVARTISGFVPGLGWVLKAGIGFGGTFATGKAVQARFEAGPGVFARGEKAAQAAASATPAVKSLPVAAERAASSKPAASRPAKKRGEVAAKHTSAGYIVIGGEGSVPREG